MGITKENYLQKPFRKMRNGFCAFNPTHFHFRLQGK